MDPFFSWLESSTLSVLVRESSTLWGFPFILILHTWGLAFLVGANVVLDLRLLGVGRDIPVRSLERYFVVMWIGFWVNAVSGVLLLVAYPTKGMTNPLFYAKLVLIAVAFTLALRIRRTLNRTSGTTEPSNLKTIAGISLACWMAAVPAGRLLAYTCSRLMVDTPC